MYVTSTDISSVLIPNFAGFVKNVKNIPFDGAEDTRSIDVDLVITEGRLQWRDRSVFQRRLGRGLAEIWGERLTKQTRRYRNLPGTPQGWVNGCQHAMGGRDSGN